MKLSILTATYNRANYLTRLYKSIIENMKSSNLEVEWIIIDDGSTDNTKKTIEKYNINLKYIYQENSGKMNAINNGMKKVTGDIVIDCDSDDYFSKDAFKIIEKNAETLFQDKKLYALCFLKKDTKGNISGKKFSQNKLKTTMFDLYFKQEIEGEKILVFNTEIRKKFRHELEKKEKFITEARMYHKMDAKYKILCINEVLQIGEYIEDGYTKNISKTFKTSPNGYYKYFKEIMKKDLKGVTLSKKLYVIKHYIFFAIKKFLYRV